MYATAEFDRALQVAQTIDTVLTVAQKALVFSIYHFARAAYLSFIAGQHTGGWYQAWFSTYIIDALPSSETIYGLTEDTVLLISGPHPVAGLLPAAAEVPAKPLRLPARWRGDQALITPAPKAKRGRKPKTETKGQPAPKSRKRANLAPRKAPNE